MRLFFVFFCFPIPLCFSEPVSPEQAGVIPITPTIFVQKTFDYPNGGGIENQELILLNNNILVLAYEDNAAAIGGSWMMLDLQGKPVSSFPLSFLSLSGQQIASTGHYAPKLSADSKGESFIYGGTYYDWIGNVDPQNRIPEYQDDLQTDDAPLFQIIDRNGNYISRCFLGLPKDFVRLPGKIRLANVQFLSDGNIILIAEDQQDSSASLFNLPKGNSSRVIACLSRPDGTIIKGPIVVQQEYQNGCIWRGLAVGTDQFGVHYEYPQNSSKVRFFNNELCPLTDEIALPKPFQIANRGERIGWCANAKNEYLLSANNGNQYYCTIMRSDGTFKFPAIPVSREEVFYNDSSDGAIDENGNFLVVTGYFPDQLKPKNKRTVVVARFFNADGSPKTDLFYVSEVPPNECVSGDERPRVTWRNGIVAISWHDRNTNLLGYSELAVRFFKNPFK